MQMSSARLVVYAVHAVKNVTKEKNVSRPLQELLDEAALAVQPILDELLQEIEESK